MFSFIGFVFWTVLAVGAGYYLSDKLNALEEKTFDREFLGEGQSGKRCSRNSEKERSIMDQFKISSAILLYVYFGTCVLTFVYKRQTTNQREKYWQDFQKPFMIILFWPIVLCFLFVCYLPLLLCVPPITTMSIFREIQRQKANSLK